MGLNSAPAKAASVHVWSRVSTERQTDEEQECVQENKESAAKERIFVDIHVRMCKEGEKERELDKRITKSKERRVKLHDRETWETWDEWGEEGMCPTKSHLTQIDCSPLCQSQLSEQTTTLMCVCVWAYTLTFSPPDSVSKVFIAHPATVLFQLLHTV